MVSLSYASQEICLQFYILLKQNTSMPAENTVVVDTEKDENITVAVVYIYKKKKAIDWFY